VSELSPYEADLEWSEINEPDDLAPVMRQLGRATAKIHCASDADSDQTLVDFQTEEAIAAVVDDDDAFVADLCDFAMSYAEQTREDHALFVEAFRAGDIGGVTAAD
jgi:tRNA A-37 threonylcarbamoyl transferase component Bud32